MTYGYNFYIKEKGDRTEKQYRERGYKTTGDAIESASRLHNNMNHIIRNKMLTTISGNLIVDGSLIDCFRIDTVASED